jgi:hypothetical protein
MRGFQKKARQVLDLRVVLSIIIVAGEKGDARRGAGEGRKKRWGVDWVA